MPEPVVAPPFGPRPLRWLLAGLAGLYLAAILGGSAGQKWPETYLNPSFRYFTQVACLFPHAARMAIEYRVEGWRCGEARFAELDTRPWFPVRPDDKENRLHRAGFFYRRERVVMEALEDYLVTAHNQAAPFDERIGGIRLASVRNPLPDIEDRPIPRFQRRPLSELPDEQVKHWFWTPRSRRDLRCTGGPP